MVFALPLVYGLAYLFNKKQLYAQSAYALNNLVDVFISNLVGEIEKYSFLPDVLSADPNISNLLVDQNNQNLIRQANHKLEQINNVSKASDIYLMNKDGTTIASSNWQLPRSFVGKNFSFRPYFKQAISGDQARYFAYGTTSKQRGYYFSSPIYKNDSVIEGVMVVKVSMSRLEQAWKDYGNDLLIADENGVVFSTNKTAWQFVQLNPLSEQSRNKIIADKQYPLDLLEPIDIDVAETLAAGEILSIKGSNLDGNYLRISRDVSVLNWQVHALEESSELRAAIFYRAIAVVLIALMLLALLYAAALRRINLTEQFEFRQKTEKELIEARDKLEIRVKKRTEALTIANQELKLEIDERQKAEQELRLAQDGLIHAARLAALGRLSAELTHELTQPLSAINSYAENAISFLQNDKPEATSNNLTEILQVCERMTQITTQLKSYARKSTEQIEVVDLSDSINNALVLLHSRIRDRQVNISLKLLDDILVQANKVRLEQVFVNLISNALDAMQAQTQPELVINQRLVDDFVITTLVDNGTGIEPEHLDHIFDPFFTTKDTGVGLGLGLSISHGIIKNFGGELTAQNNSQVGASFSVCLTKAEMT